MLSLAILIFAIDQITKLLVVAMLHTNSVAIVPYLNFTIGYNKGAAFGILDAASGWQRWFFIAIAITISIIIILWSKRLTKRDKYEKVALGLVLGGAWGNLLDRIRLGHVVDFIDFYIGNWHWYTFNVADIAICVGAVLLAFYSLRKS
jgi:signal peptidase II